MAQADVVHWGADPQYRQRMYDLLALYARPFRSQEPVVWVDEKSKRLLRDTRAPLPVKPGAPAKHDHLAFVKYSLEHVYAKPRRIHLVLDHLSTHFHVCFEAVLGVRAAHNLLRRVVFHYRLRLLAFPAQTPKISRFPAQKTSAHARVSDHAGPSGRSP